MSKFRKDDKVHIVDGAQGKAINITPQDYHISAKDGEGKLRVFSVIATGVHVLVRSDYAYGNILIMDVKTGKILVLNECNLYTPPTIEVRFFVKGKDVTDSMSDQSKQAVIQEVGHTVCSM